MTLLRSLAERLFHLSEVRESIRLATDNQLAAFAGEDDTQGEAA